MHEWFATLQAYLKTSGLELKNFLSYYTQTCKNILLTSTPFEHKTSSSFIVQCHLSEDNKLAIRHKQVWSTYGSQWNAYCVPFKVQREHWINSSWGYIQLHVWYNLLPRQHDCRQDQFLLVHFQTLGMVQQIAKSLASKLNSGKPQLIWTKRKGKLRGKDNQIHTWQIKSACLLVARLAICCTCTQDWGSCWGSGNRNTFLDVA